MAGGFVENAGDIAFDAASVAWSIKGILSNVQRISFLAEILVLALTAFVVVLTIFLALKIIRVVFGYLNTLFGGIFDFFDSALDSILSIPTRIYNFLFKRNSTETEENTDPPDDYQKYLSRLEPDEIEADVLKILNADNSILNNRDDQQNAKLIRRQLESANESYREVETSALQNVIEKVRHDVYTRMRILSVLKNKPRLIKGQTSTATKTICQNLDITNDAAKVDISKQIDVIKEIYALYKNGEKNQKILQATKTFDFEIKQLINIFNEI